MTRPPEPSPADKHRPPPYNGPGLEPGDIPGLSEEDRRQINLEQVVLGEQARLRALNDERLEAMRPSPEPRKRKRSWWRFWR